MRNLFWIVVTGLVFFSAPVFAQLQVKPDGSAEVGNLSVTGSSTISGSSAVAGTLTVAQTITAKDGFGYVPVGTILPWWDKSGTAPLPAGWHKCDGVTLTAADGIVAGSQIDVLDGLNDGKFAIPDLNHSNNVGQGGQFLRGGDVAGIPQDDMLRSHTHPAPSANFILWPGPPGGPEQDQSGNAENFSKTASETGAAGGAETRPVNVSVVWIIRVL